MAASEPFDIRTSLCYGWPWKKTMEHPKLIVIQRREFTNAQLKKNRHQIKYFCWLVISQIQVKCHMSNRITDIGFLSGSDNSKCTYMLLFSRNEKLRPEALCKSLQLMPTWLISKWSRSFAFPAWKSHCESGNAEICRIMVAPNRKQFGVVCNSKGLNCCAALPAIRSGPLLTCKRKTG